MNLPRAWNWCTGENPAGPTPAWQAECIATGDPLVPHIEFYAFFPWSLKHEYATPGMLAARTNNLPVVFVYQNLMDTFRVRAPWKDVAWSMDPAEHPFEINSILGKVVRRLSPWSHRTDFAYSLGRTLAESEYTRECAAIYPDPPYIVFADNNEVGFVEAQADLLSDIRCPERIRNLSMLIEGTPEGDTKLALTGLLRDTLTDAARLGYAAHYDAFRRGFRDGLATHAPNWAERFHWIGYGQSGNEFGLAEQKLLDQWTDLRYEAPWIGASGDHAYRHDWGPTGQIYAQPWYGGYHVVRTVVQGDNARYGMELRESQGFTAPRFQLIWEGRDTTLKARPTRQQWKGLVRYWLWVTHSEFFGHFSESQSTTAEPKIAEYYREVIDACRDVHSDPLLADFWLHGEIEPSTAPTPYEWPRNSHPAMCHQERRFCLLEVTEQNRWDPAYWAEPDKWRRDRQRRQPVHVLALSIKHEDGRRLVYVAGLEQAYEHVAVTVPGVGQREYPAPLGGAFYLVEA